MAQLQNPLETLSFCDGVATNDSPFISTAGCEAIGAPGAHSFFAILEPLSVHPDSSELAPLILDRLEQELAARMSLTATAAMSASIDSINEELHLHNRERSEQDRLFYGLTCGIARGKDLYLAQVLPSQVLIAQDSELFAFPGLETWHWSHRGDSQLQLEQPLGLHSEIEPDLYHTSIEPGDLIVLCSGSLARVIQREPQNVFLQGDPAAIVSHLRELAEAYNVGNGTCTALAVRQPTARTRKQRDFAILRRASHLFAALLPEETSQRPRGREDSRSSGVDHQASSVHTEDYRDEPVDRGLFWTDTIRSERVHSDASSNENTRRSESGAGTYDPEHWFWHPADNELYQYGEPLEETEHSGNGEGKRPLTEIILGAILALSAAVVGVWQLAVNRDRPIDGSGDHDDSIHGLPRLQRYHNSYQRPDFSSVRARLPRAPISKFTGIVSFGLMIALVSGLAFSIQHSREQERTEQFQALMERAVSARQSAAAAGDPATSESFLQASEARLGEAEEIGGDSERIAAERMAILETRDSTLGIERIGNLQVLGGIPPAPEGVSPNLFFGNGQLYIFTDALYQLNAEQNQLIRLLGAGDQVGGEPVGDLQAAAWGHGRPIAIDGQNAYIYDATAMSWTRMELGTFGDAYSGVAAISGYIGNLYLLMPSSGQIIRYNEGQFDALPEDWAGGAAVEDLDSAVDMVIDGRIYVLTDGGQVLNFYRGALDTTIEIGATPSIDEAAAFSYHSDRSYFYVADAHDRILRVTHDGEVVQQFMAAEDAPQMRNIRQIAIDDALGSGYVLTDNSLIQVRLPGPPR